MDTVLNDGRMAGYGVYDLWEFFEYGERVSCRNLRVFLHFLASSGTRRVEVTGVLEEFGAAFRVEGPIGDDGMTGLLEYQLTPDETRSFGPEEAEILHAAISRGELPEEYGTPEKVARVLGLRRELA